MSRIFSWTCPVDGTAHYSDVSTRRRGSARWRVRTAVGTHLATVHRDLSVSTRSRLADQIVTEAMARGPA